MKADIVYNIRERLRDGFKQTAVRAIDVAKKRYDGLLDGAFHALDSIPTAVEIEDFAKSALGYGQNDEPFLEPLKTFVAGLSWMKMFAKLDGDVDLKSLCDLDEPDLKEIQSAFEEAGLWPIDSDVYLK